jgi:hypothetical protein
MNKLISLFVFAAVSSTVFFGAFLSIKYSLNHNSNATQLVYLINSSSTKTLANSKVLGESIEKQKPVDSCLKIDTNNTSNSIVDILYKLGIDYTYNNRATIASELSIKDYKGTAEQNMKIISSIKEGKTCLIASLN